ncbi:MAG: hypothetical protein JNL43_07235 [Flavobacteriales bacterium]|nr:hypothetical protein [Flavobacteriales bacterium]HRH71260.1 hypothetical protein [Flavobacteriales bacterium]
MSPFRKRLLVIAFVGGHILLVLAYTLPQQWVPAHLRTVGRIWVRPLFHQQWLLFAPDPELCANELQVGMPNGEWRPVFAADAYWLERRMARPLADHVAHRMNHGDTIVLPVLERAMRSAVRDIGRDVGNLEFRLVERCVEDPARPDRRTERITLLRFSDQ